MKNFKILLGLILPLFFAACVAKNTDPQIRIVDMQGRPKPVKTKMPELNAQALAAQGFDTRTRDLNQAPQDVGYRNAPNAANNKNDFGAVSAQNIQQSLQPTQQVQQPIVYQNVEPQQVAQNSKTDVGAGSGNEAVEYDLAEAKGDENATQVKIFPTKKPVKKAAAKKVAVAKSAGGKKFFAQVGSFSSKGNADVTLSQMQKFHGGKVVEADGEKVMYRVWLGPLKNRAQANALISKIKASGSDAVLVRGE